MSSQRIQKVNELIKREVGKIIMREIEIPENSLITISQVQTSQDLCEVKIWISIFPTKYAQKVLRDIMKKIGYLQRLLNHRLSMKHVPKLNFLLDSTEEQASQVDNILKDISKSPEE